MVYKTALDAIGGERPLQPEDLGKRAHVYFINPGSNPLKDVMDRSESYDKTPPMLGIFNDIPRDVFGWDHAQIMAKAGYKWLVPDAEHRLNEGWFGVEQNRLLGLFGVTPVQRLNRSAREQHGDSLLAGARATMRPYGTTLQQAIDYFHCINYPTPGEATDLDRGGYPTRTGNRTLNFTPVDLLESEKDTQGVVQFETEEYISDIEIRDQVLDLMVEQGTNKAWGFVGPFDALLRSGKSPEEIDKDVNALFRAAAEREIHMGRVVGSGKMTDPKDIEDAMVKAIEGGAKLIAVHYLTSDFLEHGANALAEPFFNAAKHSGF